MKIFVRVQYVQQHYTHLDKYHKCHVWLSKFREKDNGEQIQSLLNSFYHFNLCLLFTTCTTCADVAYIHSQSNTNASQVKYSQTCGRNCSIRKGLPKQQDLFKKYSYYCIWDSSDNQQIIQRTSVPLSFYLEKTKGCIKEEVKQYVLNHAIIFLLLNKRGLYRILKNLSYLVTNYMINCCLVFVYQKGNLTKWIYLFQTG